MIESIQTGENEEIEVAVDGNTVFLYKSSVSEDSWIEVSIKDWFKVVTIVEDNVWGKK